MKRQIVENQPDTGESPRTQPAAQPGLGRQRPNRGRRHQVGGREGVT